MACMEWGGSDLFQACLGPGSDPIQISWLLGPALHTVHKFGHVAKTGYGAFRIPAQWRPAPEETLTFCLSRCQPEAFLSRYLPDYNGLLHDSLADCKLKGDELSGKGIN